MAKYHITIIFLNHDFMIKKIIENICNSLYMNTIILNIGGKANNVYLISLFIPF